MIKRLQLYLHVRCIGELNQMEPVVAANSTVVAIVIPEASCNATIPFFFSIWLVSARFCHSELIYFSGVVCQAIPEWNGRLFVCVSSLGGFHKNRHAADQIDQFHNVHPSVCLSVCCVCTRFSFWATAPQNDREKCKPQTLYEIENQKCSWVVYSDGPLWCKWNVMIAAITISELHSKYDH